MRRQPKGTRNPPVSVIPVQDNQFIDPWIIAKQSRPGLPHPQMNGDRSADGRGD
jgi:hypothetical protein